MRKKVNRRQILDKLQKRDKDREKVTFYLSASLYEDFKAACEDVPASRVVEELMRGFIK